MSINNCPVPCTSSLKRSVLRVCTWRPGENLPAVYLGRTAVQPPFPPDHRTNTIHLQARRAHCYCQALRPNPLPLLPIHPERVKIHEHVPTNSASFSVLPSRTIHHLFTTTNFSRISTIIEYPPTDFRGPQIQPKFHPTLTQRVANAAYAAHTVQNG